MKQEHHEEPMEQRPLSRVSLISIACGAVLAWLGYRSLDTNINDSLFDTALGPVGFWQLIITLLGISLLISGITGLLRGR